MRMRKKPWARPELESCDFFVINPKEYKGKWKDFFGNDKPIYLELIKDNEFKDYRIQKLEQEIRDLQSQLIKHSNPNPNPKTQYEGVQIYV